MTIKERIEKLTKDVYPDVVKIYHHLHQNPELSFQEFQTADFICQQLEKLKIPYKKGFAKTGIVATIICQNPLKKVVALRADMDALPVLEDLKLNFKSKNEGIMHACGHDIHMANLLGSASILNTLKDEIEGTVLLVFQPGEEKLPGGAKTMLDEKALDPAPHIVIGQHVMPELPAGIIGLKPGKYMASTDEIFITIKGEGGHAAMPERFTDTVLIASQIIVTLQQVVSRKANPSIPSVLSFGKVTANGATNIIPGTVAIEGTFRTMDEKWRYEAHKIISDITQSTAQMMGGSCEIKVVNGYPALTNDDTTSHLVRDFLSEYLGDDKVVTLEPQMTAEDFAYFAETYPSVFYRLGTGIKGESNPPLHSSQFIVNENALLTGIGSMAYIAYKLLCTYFKMNSG